MSVFTTIILPFKKNICIFSPCPVNIIFPRLLFFSNICILNCFWAIIVKYILLLSSCIIVLIPYNPVAITLSILLSDICNIVPFIELVINIPFFSIIDVALFNVCVDIISPLFDTW